MLRRLRISTGAVLHTTIDIQALLSYPPQLFPYICLTKWRWQATTVCTMT